MPFTDIIVFVACFGLAFCLAGLAFNGLMLRRNTWVYRQRVAVLNRPDFRALERDYLSYDEMMHRWWVWDFEKLRKPS